MIPLAAVLCVVLPALHEIHTTHTVVHLERGAMELRIRAFADDLSAAVAKLHGRAAPSDSSVSETELERYVRANVRITDRAGREARLVPCGVERVREVYLLCYRADGAPGERLARLDNTILTERHADQVNIIQFVRGGSRKSVLLTRGGAPAEIPARLE